MPEPIIALTTIALQAGEAAREWAHAKTINPQAVMPANPYDRDTTPDHHEAWRRLFDVAVPRYDALPETEGRA